ncbi:phytoene desaturase family protein [Cohnella abietis]|uniref:4,4'-diaponeurosporene oxygenase n=1 Tax=Cohnella abietis TaxID=2507935 RepID=A0A3T1D6C7_9BACL|nr:phytoene desaturase family protein [Cohnella abietis]BBI33636.1 diapolycopene oxygenase [Cohnella abietis]
MKRVVVIGGGLGGLSAAIRLATAGFSVTVLEQQPTLGGKLQRIQLGHYTFDRGPSTITMPEAFRRVFTSAGRKMEDYIQLYKLNEGTRNIFSDGTTVDLSSDLEAVESQISAYSLEDAAQYKSFMKESEILYRLAECNFMTQILGWKEKLQPRMALAFARVRPFMTMDKLLRRYFHHPNTIAMFGRYATYVGSSPWSAPAIFGMLPHMENALGIYGVKGGTYAIVEGFSRLARELGVTIKTGVRVTRILSRNGRAVGVSTDQGYYDADYIVANGDVLSVCEELLDDKDRGAMSRKKVTEYEPSLSGFVQLVGVKQEYPQLLHHNVFYPNTYSEEFQDLFIHRVPPSDPAIYVCHSGHSERGMAPEGASNLFILVNAPYLSDLVNWDNPFTKQYGERILDKLASLGIEGLRDAEVRMSYTPLQLKQDTSAYRGAIYGISSNSPRQTFARPSNRGPISGLWFVGGTTHPGGGTPMVAMSGQLVAESLIKHSGV